MTDDIYAPQDDSIKIDRLSVEHYSPSSPNVYLGIAHESPRLSWRFGGRAVNWLQASYVLTVIRGDKEQVFEVTSDASVLVPWPGLPLSSKERALVRVQVTGEDGTTLDSDPVIVERALMQGDSDWNAKVISSSVDPVFLNLPLRPFQVRKTFTTNAFATPPHSLARLYVTALGLYEVSINGRRVGDQLLAPGWQSYDFRHSYQTYDVTSLLNTEAGEENVISAWVAEGWYAGELTKYYKRSWGTRAGFLAQLEIDGQTVCATDETWEWAYGAIVEAGLYHGEVWDFEEGSELLWQSVEVIEMDKSKLASCQSPPVREIQKIEIKEILRTPKGHTVIDFGQNLVGFVRINREAPIGTREIILKHAEVLEQGEIGMRPLRDAKCRDHLRLSPSGQKSLTGWQPKFTFHGFRYVEIEGWEAPGMMDFTAIVIHTDMEKTAEFECSHKLVNRLHQNVEWSMRGNFLSVPTDCPQRDERLGWTGDLQVFAPTANYLYDTSAILGDWLSDLAHEQLQHGNGVPPVIVPDISRPVGWPKLGPQAVWGDTVVLTPWDMYMAFGDKELLANQYPSMIAWLDKGLPRDPLTRLWSPRALLLGDWLDPSAPSDQPWKAKTDQLLVGDAYLVHTTRVMAKVAQVLDRTSDHERYTADAQHLCRQFRSKYVTEVGRMASDSPTAFALALKFDLLEPSQVQGAMQRLSTLINLDVFRIGTGFAGTPVILQALLANGGGEYAYRMLQEAHCPSWLYPVTMGATTIWERWDSMLPDGAINPGQMTSFNHYALGCVAEFLHTSLGGLSSIEPGWRKIRFAPMPGGSFKTCATSHLSPYGRISCEWEILEKADGYRLSVSVMVPPNCTALVELPGLCEKVGSGTKVFQVKWTPSSTWPPKAFQVPVGTILKDEPA